MATNRLHGRLGGENVPNISEEKRTRLAIYPLHRLMLILAVVLALGAPLPVIAAVRMALVIGNSNYVDSQLRNPVNDATDVATQLEDLGFKVDLVLDADRRALKDRIYRFIERLRGSDVGLFYYAGHGVEVGGQNYLIPINAEIRREYDVEYEAVNVGHLLAGMEQAGNELNFVILDACRNNPYRSSFRSVNRGLQSVTAPKGTLIMYSAQPGAVARDGEGRNGTFTKHFLQSLQSPGLKVEEVFKETAKGVYRETREQQLPYIEGVILGDFYFITPEVNINISVDEPVRDVEGILAVCESHFEANRLTLPEDRNALECYEQVLAIDPGNREAVKGLDTIESKYQDWLALAMTERDQEKTDRYRKILQKLNPDSPFVQQLEKVQAEAERTDELDEARKRQEREKQKAEALVESKVQEENKLTKQQMPEQEQDGKETPKAEQLAKANMPGARPDPDSPYNGTWEGTMHCSPTQSGSSKAFSKWVLLKINGDRVFLTGDHAMGDGTQEGSISFKGGLFSKPGKIRIAGKEKHMDGWLLDYRYAGYHGEEIVLKGKRGSRSCKIKLARTTGSSS